MGIIYTNENGTYDIPAEVFAQLTFSTKEENSSGYVSRNGVGHYVAPLPHNGMFFIWLQTQAPSV